MIRPRAILSVLLAMTPALTPVLAGADHVRTRDGQIVEGSLRLEAGQVAVQPKQGPELKFDLPTLLEIVQRGDQGEQALTLKPPANESPQPLPLPPEPGPLQGLRAEYYSDREMKDPQLVRIDKGIWFALGGIERPHPQVNRDFYARWVGQIQMAHTQAHQFRVDTNGGTRLWIDGKLLVDQPDNTQSLNAMALPIELEANRKYDIRCEFYASKSPASMRLSFFNPRKNRVDVMPRMLAPPEGSKPAAVTILSPRHSELLAAPDRMLFDVAVDDPDGGVAQVRYYIDDRLHYTQEAPPWRHEWTQPLPGARKLSVEAVNADGLTSPQASADFIVTGNGAGTLPSPWAEAPIGSGNWIGSSRHENGLFTLKARRGDLYGRGDLMHFVFQPLSGDVTVVARMERIGPDAPTTAAGILLRAPPGTKADVPEVFFGMSPVNMIRMYRDPTTGGKRAGEEKFTPPRWLKLSRHGSTISFSQSENGKEWQLLNQRHVELPEALWVGLASVGSPERPSEAVFSNVSITPGAPEMESSVTGLLLRGGTLLAGDPISIDDTSVKLKRGGEELTVPLNQVAMVLFRPLPSEMAAKLDRRTGALLVSADFKDGTVSLKDGQVQVDSLLFPTSRHKADTEVIAAVVGELNARPRRYEITAADGSTYKCDVIQVVGDQLKITDAAGLTFHLRAPDLRRLQAKSAGQ